MFEAVGAMFNSVGISGRKAAVIGAGVVAAYYFGPALAECVNPKEVCTDTSRYFGLVTDRTCGVPTTFCQTAMNSVMSGLGTLLKGVAITTGVAALVSAAAEQASHYVYHTPKETPKTQVDVYYNGPKLGTLKFNVPGRCWGSRTVTFDVANQTFEQLKKLYGTQFGEQVSAKMVEIMKNTTETTSFTVDGTPVNRGLLC